jgi:hypothetical protein
MMLPVVALIAALVAPAPPPKHDDSGCCLQFDDSPVTIVFCTTKDACTIPG